MILASIAVALGLALLFWSADRFVSGAAATARHLGMPSLLIGMLVVGFGTSAPEMLISALSAMQGNPGLALGNAYGSNIMNLALVLGLTALFWPVRVRPEILRRELPILTAVTGLALVQLWDGDLSRWDAWALLGVFAGLMAWNIGRGLRQGADCRDLAMAPAGSSAPMSLSRALWWLVIGLTLLSLSSRLLVWGAVELARGLGVNDLIIGLTVVAVGTSLPELASTSSAVRKGEHDIALGNLLGSNLFNTLAVVGIAGAIHPMPVAPEVISRDMLVMSLLTLSLFLLGYGRNTPGRINRFDGLALIASYVGYSLWLAKGAFSA